MIYNLEIRLKELHLELKDTNMGRCLYYNGLPLPRTLNKSDEYLDGFINGFARGRQVENRENKEGI